MTCALFRHQFEKYSFESKVLESGVIHFLRGREGKSKHPSVYPSSGRRMGREGQKNGEAGNQRAQHERPLNAPRRVKFPMSLHGPSGCALSECIISDIIDDETLCQSPSCQHRSRRHNFFFDYLIGSYRHSTGRSLQCSIVEPRFIRERRETRWWLDQVIDLDWIRLTEMIQSETGSQSRAKRW